MGQAEVQKLLKYDEWQSCKEIQAQLKPWEGRAFNALKVMVDYGEVEVSSVKSTTGPKRTIPVYRLVKEKEDGTV